MAATLGDAAKARFPRLLAALQRAAGLDESEALDVLVEYQVLGMTNEFTNATVARLGGQLGAIRHANRRRHALHGAPTTRATSTRP